MIEAMADARVPNNGERNHAVSTVELCHPRLSTGADAFAGIADTPEALYRRLDALYEPRSTLKLQRARQRLCWAMTLHGRLGHDSFCALHLPGSAEIHEQVALAPPSIPHRLEHCED